MGGGHVTDSLEVICIQSLRYTKYISIYLLGTRHFLKVSPASERFPEINQRRVLTHAPPRGGHASSRFSLSSLKYWIIGRLDTLNRKMVASDPSLCPRGHFRTWKVTNSFSAITFDRQARGRKTTQMCSNRRNGSTDMQHHLFRTGHGLDLRPNFQNGVLRSNYSSLDASWQE